MGTETNEIVNVEMKAIPGWDGYYSATKDGRIYRHATSKRKGGFVGLDRKTKYIRIRLVRENYKKWEYVHRLVAITFIPNQSNKPQVNHRNLNPHDNRVENLEWCTWRENWEHARDNKRYKGRMLKENEKIAVGILYETGDYSVSKLVTMFNSSTSSITRHIKAYREAT